VPTETRPGGLPSGLTRFIGREDELAEVSRLLGRSPLVTLTGPAGCGKTRLALEIAAREAAGSRRRVRLVELSGLARPDLVPAAVAAALGVPTVGSGEPSSALTRSLAQADLLLVLDNCEHLVAACAGLAEELLQACPDVGVLATSREPLRAAGEVVWRVRSLTFPNPVGPLDLDQVARYESVRLFVDRAASAKPGFALTADCARAVARICHGLDGIPLAIELAAARVAALPPSQIADRLCDAMRLLRCGPRTAVTRQETLEGALDWSHRLLDPVEAALLRRLAVMSAGAGLDAIEAICAGDPLAREDVLEVLLRLVDKSLVVAADAPRSEPRYRLLEMVRQYAAARLVAAGESDVTHERHARWYLELAEREGNPGRPGIDPERMRRLDAEQDNLRAALGWLVERDPSAALRLAGSLCGYWLLRGRLAEGRRWLEAALAHAPRAAPDAAVALLRALPFVVRLGEVARGARMAERSLAISRELGDPGGAAEALHLLGLVHWVSGRYARARETLERSAEAALLAGSLAAEANAAHALGIVATSAGDLAAARSYIERSLELGDRVADRVRPAFLVVGSLVPLTGRGMPPRRLVHEESQVMFRWVGFGGARPYALMSLAVVARLEGDLVGADALLRDALAGLRAADDAAGVAQAVVARGRIATLAGEWARAGEFLCEGLALRRRLGDVRGVGLTLGLLAELAAARGSYDRARSLLHRALAIFDEAGDQPPVQLALLSLAHVELAAGRRDEARRHLERSLALAEGLGSGVVRGWALASLAEAELAAGSSRRAARLVQDARAVFEELGDRWGLERCDALAAEVALAARPAARRPRSC
jgi:predicted ATPase